MLVYSIVRNYFASSGRAASYRCGDGRSGCRFTGVHHQHKWKDARKTRLPAGLELDREVGGLSPHGSIQAGSPIAAQVRSAKQMVCTLSPTCMGGPCLQSNFIRYLLCDSSVWSTPSTQWSGGGNASE